MYMTAIERQFLFYIPSWNTNCYDCVHCEYEDYGKGGICEKEYPDPPAFEELGARYYEWEEPAGAFPYNAWKYCLYWVLGEKQAIQKTIRILQENILCWKDHLEQSETPIL